MPIDNLANSKISLNLSNPDITFLHSAGIAGLSMTLERLEQLYPMPALRPGNLNWLLTPRSISLNWEGKDLIALDWLLKQSFQINDEGLINFVALNYEKIDIYTQILIHQGITGTFLQHNNFFKSAGVASKSLIINDIKLTLWYKKAASYAHQNFANKLCDEHGNMLQQHIRIAGWLYPGAVVRHAAFNDKSKFEEKPEYALALLFAPVACQYFVLRSHVKPNQMEYALVIPEVTNLENYNEPYNNHSNWSYSNFHVSSLGEAGLKFLVHQKSVELARCHQIKQCQVIYFGVVEWSKQQKTPMAMRLVNATETICSLYKMVSSYFPEYKIHLSKDNAFIISSFVKSIIADNLSKNLPWWSNFYTTINFKNNQNKFIFNTVFYENRSIYKMVQNSDWDSETQKLYIQLCQEALKKRYAKIYSQTQEGEYTQIERENMRILSQLKLCISYEKFRKFITQFIGEAGKLTILETHWQELLPIVSGETDWKLARDLFFIALAGYPRSQAIDASAHEEKYTVNNSSGTHVNK
ncbi:MAG: type I-MYXAN CRISPR-associated Cas8a1/Cmx1 [Calothrix sp. FI2-JRJ7]|jgi:CRISPR-associated protein Cas8a1/Csx13|nr:type I-MYXAN CRISPR-associated Cas8a1/Cmx1 [Calothrix sp. FI2-JRJ7]